LERGEGPYDAIVLMGPPGSGKSFLGNDLSRRGITSFVELEPILRQRFGTGEAFRARIREAGALLVRSYREQLARSALPVAFESTGVSDRAILEELMRDHRVGLARVKTARAICVARVVSRPAGANINETADRELVGRLYDRWTREIAPTYRFDLEVDGTDVEAAALSLRAFLEKGWRPSGPRTP
jgi:adenylate kinase family enzyme